MAVWLRIILGLLLLVIAGLVYYFWIYRITRGNKRNSVLRK
jgi:hypothetical protein